MIDTTGRHPSITDLVRLFDTQHLTHGELTDVSVMFEQLVADLLDALPDGPMLTAAIRHLWDAKNNAVAHKVLQLDLERGAPAVTVAPGERVR